MTELLRSFNNAWNRLPWYAATRVAVMPPSSNNSIIFCLYSFQDDTATGTTRHPKAPTRYPERDQIVVRMLLPIRPDAQGFSHRGRHCAPVLDTSLHLS